MISKKLFLFFLLLIPVVYGFDCSWSNDVGFCESINDSYTVFEKDLLYSSVFYNNSFIPLHNLVKEYNEHIVVSSPPEGVVLFDSSHIKDSWLSLLVFYPSVLDNGSFYVGGSVNVLSGFNYYVDVPKSFSYGYPQTDQGDCSRIYYLQKNESELKHYFSSNFVNNPFIVSKDGTISLELVISSKILVNHYRWRSYCCASGENGCTRYCHNCRYYRRSYLEDSVTLSDSVNVLYYDEIPSGNVTIVNEYFDTYKGFFNYSGATFFSVNFGNKSISEQKYFYSVIFDKQPYDYAHITAKEYNKTFFDKLIYSEKHFYLNNITNCTINAYNHFTDYSEDCDIVYAKENISEFKIEKTNTDFSLLLKLLMFVFLLYIIYRIAKKRFKPIFILLVLLVFVSPIVLADDDSCGITNLSSCLPEKMYEYFLLIINAPLLPFLEGIKALLTTKVEIGLFKHLWSIVRYIISSFYVFLFVYAGYIFLTANNSPFKRNQAKDLLKNTVLMIILIQGSFYIYDLLLGISSALTNSILPLIDPHFFMITADNLNNIGLEFMYTSAYTITLFGTLLMLTLRYLMVSLGVILFPIGIFLYFLPPVKSYGKFIINLILIYMFITSINILTILVSATLLQITLFENMKILVMIMCFTIINYTIILAIKFTITKSSSNIKEDIGQAIKYVSMMV